MVFIFPLSLLQSRFLQKSCQIDTSFTLAQACLLACPAPSEPVMLLTPLDLVPTEISEKGCFSALGL